MLADLQFIIDAQQKDSVQARLVAKLIVLYRSCLKSKHPHSLEMARHYEQELRQLAGGVETGKVNGPRAVIVNASGAY